LKKHPNVMADNASNAKVCLDLATVLGFVMAKVLYERGEDYFKIALERTMQHVSVNARETHYEVQDIIHGLQARKDDIGHSG
jgi:hypothetical protein